jgi:glucosylceramidase
MSAPSPHSGKKKQSSTKKQGQRRPGKIRLWVTSEKKQFAQGPEPSWQLWRGTSSGSIVLTPGQTYQEILGFGAALTDSACYLLNQLAPSSCDRFLRELFDPAALGLNVSRVCIGSSDYATEVYSYADDGPDPELKRFSVDHDRRYIIPIVKRVRELCPDLFLLASPWSPPGWMKPNGSMLGGSMQRKYFPTYCDYFLKFLEAYAEAGIPIDAVTVQNEVDTDQEGLMPACLWGQEHETRFIAEHLGPRFAERSIETKIWILDHNYNLWGRVLGQLADPRVRRYVDGVAWHGYAGEPSAMTRVHHEHLDKHAYWTEGGPEELYDPRYPTNWAFWGARFGDILRNWARCIIAWNLALDENGKPNVGPYACGGLVTIDSKTKQITPSGQYWALIHYSRAVRRGARRIQSQGALENVSHVAFLNSDGSYAVVLTNSGAERTVYLRLDRLEMGVDLPGDSVATLVWSC